ncbi:hypothetical protein D9M72_620600 [compost metagenome]
MNSRTRSTEVTLGNNSGAMRVRTRLAIGPSAVTKLNTRSVVATSLRAKAMRSGS